jgi:hypothetical protein
LIRATFREHGTASGPAEHQVVDMVLRSRWFHSRLVTGCVALALTALTSGVAVGTPYAAARGVPDGLHSRLELPLPRAAGGQVDLTAHPLDVVSSTGHHLSVLLHAGKAGTGVQIGIGVETRDGAEEHDWNFSAPASAVTIAAGGHGRIRLTSKRSAGLARVSLRLAPHSSATHTMCQGETATRTRHVSLSGTLLLHTRSTGKHAWGSVGSAHRTLHFSARSTVTWTKTAAQNCPTPSLPCRNTFTWQVSGGTPGVLELMLSANKGAHAEIGGLRSVPLAEPAGATRSDLAFLRAGTPNQLIVAGDGSATMQTSLHGGTATLTSANPAITSTQPCRDGRKKGKLTVDDWPGAVFTNGPVPIHVPAQIFGGFSMPDGSPADFARLHVKR